MRLRALLAATAVLLLARPARALDTQRAQDAVVLEYLPSAAAAEVCYPADYFYDEIVVRLGFQLFQVTGPYHLTVKVDRVKERFTSELELRDESGHVVLANDFNESNCVAALRSVLVVIAVHFTRLPEPVPCVPTPPPPAPAPSPVPPPAPVPALTSDYPRYEGGLATVFSLGKAPVVLGGAGVFFGLRWRYVSAALEGRALFFPSVGVEDTSVTYSFLGASLSTCGHLSKALACLRAEAGTLFGSSANGKVSPDHVRSGGVALRLARDWDLSSLFAVRPYFELMAEAVPARFVVHDRMNPLWNSPFLSASIGLGLVMSSPVF